ncbi:Glycerol-3-phosphate dehydrogenase [NAD(P)+] [Clostridiaceae bacterium JG1575]|nr:Glycerol-3-phosphate dehydrogenase [NAD(P)+] [Clostridiaceae bacterium JG1575]
MKLTFLGAGSFGSALALAMTYAGHEVTLWDRSMDTVREINEKHKNHRYLPEISLPQKLWATKDLAAALASPELLIFAVPSSAVREMTSKVRPYLRGQEILVCIAKGVDPKTLAPLSEVFLEELGREAVILSGPSHAEEVALGLPTTMVASSRDELAMLRVQEAFSTDTLRIYRNHDLLGVEIGGAVKNIIALAAGISDGVGFGDNAKAALMTRGMAEIIRVGEKMGAKSDTFYGLTGMGDLIVTCTSMHSRNRRCGILLGQGKSMKEATEEVGMVVEGIKATQSFYELAHRLKVEMPITEAVHQILFENVRPRDAVYQLMNRELKRE